MHEKDLNNYFKSKKIHEKVYLIYQNP